MVRDAPEVVAHNLLRDNWDSTNTSNVTPLIHHGWVDLGADEPEVTISDPDENVLGGGETGYSGLSADGSPVQDFTGTVTINVWTDRKRSNVNPRKLAWEMRCEVGRILHENYDPTPTYDLYPIADLGARRFVDSESDETMWRYQVTMGYGYRQDAR